LAGKSPIAQVIDSFSGVQFAGSSTPGGIAVPSKSAENIGSAASDLGIETKIRQAIPAKTKGKSILFFIVIFLH
jgi:hypothetical protein